MNLVKKISNYFLFLLLVLLLTILTQIGGLILILTIPGFLYINRKTKKRFKRKALKTLTFLAIYLFLTFTIVPLLAKSLGRVPMPVFQNANLKPLNIITCLLNRHYVKPELFNTTKKVVKNLEEKHPNVVVSYLDANFPFIKKFPMFPHLSHDDGKKLDIAFFYLKTKDNKPVNHDAPSFIGYGVYEQPLEGEVNMPKRCKNKGYWQYSFLQYLVPDWTVEEMELDKQRTGKLITFLVQANSVDKIFIEPHLKERMKLNYKKIRFHGCHAVRHDDHIHLEVK